MSKSYPRLSSNPGPSNLFALLIGINQYPARAPESQLRGAVSDAGRILDLLEGWEVEASHICTLYDDQATHARIIEELDRFVTNDNIKKGHNTIFIYFAGHGSSKPKALVQAESMPGFWDDWNEDHIELLCPYDIGLKKDGREVCGIPNKVLSYYLNRIAEAKGDNIILMLDCCYSAGMTRQELEDSNAFRCLSDTPPFDAQCWPLMNVIGNSFELDDRKTSAERGVSLAENFSAMFDRSHILLAACSRSQALKEQQRSFSYGGIFTDLFLKVLAALKCLHGISYKTLFTLMSISPGLRQHQTPHCNGYYIGREVFSLDFADQAKQRISAIARSGKLVMSAGYAHGVRPNHPVHLYANNLIESSLMTVATAAKIGLFQTELALPPMVAVNPRYPYCAHFRASGRLLIFPSNTSGELSHQLITIILKKVSQEQIPDDESYSIVSSKDEGHFTLTLSENEMIFQFNSIHLDPHFISHGTFTCGRIQLSQHDSEVPRLTDVFKWARHYMYHVTLPSPYETHVSLELFEVNDSGVAIGPNIVDSRNCAFVECGSGKPCRKYGIILRNNGDKAYYPSLISFNCNLSSSVLYKPSIGVQEGEPVDGKLECGSWLGWGCQGNSSPIEFELSDGVTEEISILKLILTTQSTDIACLEQACIFETKEPRNGENVAALDDEVVASWGSVSVIVIQKP